MDASKKYLLTGIVSLVLGNGILIQDSYMAYANRVNEAEKRLAKLDEETERIKNEKAKFGFISDARSIDTVLAYSQKYSSKEFQDFILKQDSLDKIIENNKYEKEKTIEEYQSPFIIIEKHYSVAKERSPLGNLSLIGSLALILSGFTFISRSAKLSASGD